MRTAPKPETSYDLCPAGTHIARLYKIIDLGTHDGEYQGRPKVSRLIRIYWELPNEIKEYEKDGQKVSAPFAISREFTFSMGEKANLRKIVQGMIGTILTDDEAYNFDVDKLVGEPCLITVVHETSKTGNKYALVSTTAPMMRGMEAPAQFNKNEILDVSEMTEDEIGKQPQWLMDKLRESHEYKRMTGTMITPNTASDTSSTPAYPEPGTNGVISPEDIPF